MPKPFITIPKIIRGSWNRDRKIAAPDNPMIGSTSVRWCAQHAIILTVDVPVLVAITADDVPDKWFLFIMFLMRVYNPT